MFSGCNALTTIIMPESPEIIGNDAFAGLNITSMIIPEGVTEIRNAAFKSCHQLTYVKIPDSIERIGNFAFEDCIKLVRIDILAKQIQYGSFGLFGGWNFSDFNSNSTFANNISLPIAERQKIEATGYRGTFVNR